ncbi:MAG: glycerate kinase [Nocardioides sp.]
MTSRPRVVVAPDKFRGSLSAEDVGRHVAAGLLVARPDLAVEIVPIADGGEGTLAAALRAGFEPRRVPAHGPTGEAVVGTYAVRDGVAVVELAAVAGLDRLPGAERSPLVATSRGAGDLVAAALSEGCRRVVLGVGGSASTDGGAGLLRGLGARLLDEHGREVPDGGGSLSLVRRLDLTGLHPATLQTEIVLASDVDNVLLGSSGAARIYGPQKGADPEQVATLEAGLSHWVEVVREAVGEADPDAPGAGAAGGVGFAAIAVCGAVVVPGIDVVMRLLGVRDRLAGAALVVTGEGSLDGQSLRGKATAGIAAAARAFGVRAVAVAGQSSLSEEVASSSGFWEVYPLTAWARSLAECFERPGELLEEIGERIAHECLVEPPASLTPESGTPAPHRPRRTPGTPDG